MDSSIAALYRAGRITQDTALTYCVHVEAMKQRFATGNK
jgi:hypothetical protein